MNKIGLLLLAGLTMGTMAQQPITSISFALKGDIGTTHPFGPEKVDISWKAKSGKSYSFKTTEAMSTGWQNYTITVPSGEQPASVTFNYLNDKMWNERGKTLDKNIRLDMTNFRLNNVPVANLTRFMGGPVYDQWKNNDDYNRMIMTQNGILAWNGEYIVTIPTPKPSTSDCDNLNVSNIVCFDLRGDIGFSIPSQEEHVRIAYETVEGKKTEVYADYALSQSWERFMVKAGASEKIKRVIVSFLNDRVWNVTGVEKDRNVRFNVASMHYNHVRIPSMTPYIRGPRYDTWVKAKDALRTGNVVGGFFAWQDDYYLEIPGPTDGCFTPGATGALGKLNTLCFSLKGKAAKYNPSRPEFVQVSYATSTGAQVVTHDVLPVGIDWQVVKVTVPSGQTAKNLTVKILPTADNSTLPAETGVDFSLTTVGVNGQSLTDVTPGLDAVPILNQLLNVLVES